MFDVSGEFAPNNCMSLRLGALFACNMDQRSPKLFQAVASMSTASALKMSSGVMKEMNRHSDHIVSYSCCVCVCACLARQKVKQLSVWYVNVWIMSRCISCSKRDNHDVRYHAVTVLGFPPCHDLVFDQS